MAKKKPPKPSIVVLPDGSRHRCTPLRVEECYEDGTPKTLTMLRDNDVTDLRVQSNRFIFAYINEVHFGNGGLG